MLLVCVFGILRSHNRMRDTEQTKNNEKNEKKKFSFVSLFFVCSVSLFLSN